MFGVPLAYLLQVYGGRRGIYGNLATVLSMPQADHAKAPNMVGIGTTPEAIDEIPLMFEAAFEAGWRAQPANAASWIQDYAVRRYGRRSQLVSEGMTLLLGAAYNRSIDTSSIEKVPEVMEDGEPGYRCVT